MCFGFTICSEEQILFTDIHVLFKKHSGAKLKERNQLMVRKVVSFEEQITSKDKSRSKFSCKIEALVFILQIVCNARGKLFTNRVLFSAWDIFF